jgi:hypothetical protein
MPQACAKTSITYLKKCAIKYLKPSAKICTNTSKILLEKYVPTLYNMYQNIHDIHQALFQNMPQACTKTSITYLEYGKF